MMRFQRQQYRALPLWWVRCAIVALACIQVIAPTWHVCSMGASGQVPGQRMSMAQCSCPTPQSSSHQDTLTNLPMEDFCLARLLQHVLGNSQFQLVLDFSTQTVAILQADENHQPETGALPVKQARGPPLSLAA